MSMKLDEYSINLKEEAEIKGGGVFANLLPKGFSKEKALEIQDSENDGQLIKIKISKKSSFRGKAIPQFTKFDKLFGDEKNGKRLHFLIMGLLFIYCPLFITEWQVTGYLFTDCLFNRRG